MKNKIRYSKGCAGIVLVILLLTSVLAFSQRMPVIEHYKDSANTTQFLITVPRDSLLYGPWLTIGQHTYQDWVQTMWRKTDSTYVAKMTFIYMTGTVTAPERIEGTDFADQQGIVVEDTILGYIEPGDWLRYLARDFTNKNTLAFRYSYGNAEAGRKMEVRIDSLTGPVIGEWTQKTTGNWNEFAEDEIALAPVTGMKEIFLVFTGSTPGYVMNIDWIELRYKEE